MHLMMRILICAMLCVPYAANARTVTLVVGFQAGGTSTLAANYLKEGLEKTADLTVVLINKPGVGGRLAADFVKDQSPDGTTLLVVSSTSLLKIPPDMGIVPVAHIATFPYVVAIAPDVRADSLGSYRVAALTKARLQLYAVPGQGTLSHLIGELLAREMGIPLTPVQFRGSAEAIQQVVGGHVPMTIVPMPDYLPFRESIRAFGVTGDVRSPHLPDVPTVSEQGIAIRIEGWIGVFAPQHTPHGVVQELNRLVIAALAPHEKRLRSSGFEPYPAGAEALAKRHKSDFDRMVLFEKELKQ